jgi:hypothetical protein
MEISSQRLVQRSLASFLLITLNACSLLTVERIDDQRPLETAAPRLEATLAALEGQIGEQAEMIQFVATQVSYLSTQNAQQDAQITYLATRGPAPTTSAGNPAPTISIVVVGVVEVEGGKCCVGGTAGEEIDIGVRFTAIGLEAPVTEMRHTTGSYANLDQDFDTLDWGSYVEEKSFTYQIPINWTGFYVRVQFRDALGNISPIYTDDISVEGSPPLTPSPWR